MPICRLCYVDKKAEELVKTFQDVLTTYNNDSSISIPVTFMEVVEKYCHVEFNRDLKHTQRVCESCTSKIFEFSEFCCEVENHQKVHFDMPNENGNLDREFELAQEEESELEAQNERDTAVQPTTSVSASLVSQNSEANKAPERKKSRLKDDDQSSLVLPKVSDREVPSTSTGMKTRSMNAYRLSQELRKSKRQLSDSASSSSSSYSCSQSLSSSSSSCKEIPKIRNQKSFSNDDSSSSLEEFTDSDSECDEFRLDASKKFSSVHRKRQSSYRKAPELKSNKKKGNEGADKKFKLEEELKQQRTKRFEAKNVSIRKVMYLLEMYFIEICL